MLWMNKNNSFPEILNVLKGMYIIRILEFVSFLYEQYLESPGNVYLSTRKRNICRTRVVGIRTESGIIREAGREFQQSVC
jgi:hypothetical protein